MSGDVKYMKVYQTIRTTTVQRTQLPILLHVLCMPERTSIYLVAPSSPRVQRFPAHRQLNWPQVLS